MLVNLMCPLTIEDIDKLKNGEILTPHYHGVVYLGDTYLVLIGKEFNKRDYDIMLSSGINVLSCRLNNGDIDKLDKSLLEIHYDDGINLFIYIHSELVKHLKGVMKDVES